MRNLDYIEKNVGNREGESTYEVTQLLNSLSGLVIYPLEHWQNEISTASLCETFNIEHLPKFLHGQLSENNTRGLIRHIRNALAHFNTAFANESGQIKGVYIWSRPPNEKPDWVAYISIESLRGLVNTIAELFLAAMEDSEVLSDPVSNLEQELDKPLRCISWEARN